MKPLGNLCALVFAAALNSRAADAGEQHFIQRVKPLLESRCVSCHGPEKIKAGLRLDSREAMLKGGENGPALVPGKPSQSLLLQAVMHSKKDLEMPPKERLTSNDIAVLEHWIRDGAPWPKSEVIAAAAPKLAPGERLGDAWHDSRNPIVRIFGGQRLDLWSLQPVKRIEPPSVKNKRWVRTPIDRFILAKIEAGPPHPSEVTRPARLPARRPEHAGSNAGETPGMGRRDARPTIPSAEADRRTLARRLHFDLIGLPPTPEQVQRFVTDQRRDAYERLVDELLDSPRYGEHWARAWLDVIRYSDSNGFDWDEFRPKAWRFRDYVIRSFNADKPFDQFIREQLAGDELIDGPPKNSSEQDALIATGYLRLGPQDNSAGAFNEQDRARAEWMTDLTETTGAAFLGLTVSCCRCHDHKYDPLSQADHYRLRAFFEPVKYADDTPLDLAQEQESIRAHNQALDEQLKPLEQERDTLMKAAKKRLRDERTAKLSADEKAILDVPKEQRTNDLKIKIEALEKKIEPSEKETKAALNDEEKGRHSKLEKEIATMNKQKRDFTLGLLASDNAEKVSLTKILFQGDYRAPRDSVEAGFISVLDPNPASIRSAVNRKTTGRRLTLANWIASPDNPLTARVLVNRVWQGYFGHGLVATPNDFGLAGGRPTHPELLDWLASEFVRQGWSLKKLHWLIVTSAVYRQTTTVKALNGTSVDPASKSAFQTLRRLSAEQLRDALLAVPGLLTTKAGGPPAWPSLPAEILQANPAFLDDSEMKMKGWYPSAKPDQNVRSVYLVQKRTVRVPFLETFDLPENSVSCPRRNISTVAPQALSLLNSPLAIEAARAFASRVKTEAGDQPEAQIKRAFALAFQRQPSRDEIASCQQLLRQRSLTELCRALLNLNEFAYLD